MLLSTLVVRYQVQHQVQRCLVLLSGISLLLSACSPPPPATQAPSAPVKASAKAVTKAAVPAPSPTSSAVAASKNSEDSFQEAINTAQGAAVIAQTAGTADDWRLVANRWQTASQLMATVPSNSVHHSAAQSRVRQYQANMNQALQRAVAVGSRPAVRATVPGQTPVVAAVPVPSPVQPLPVAARPPRRERVAAAASGPVRIPLLGRQAGIAIVKATFNRSQAFPIMVDSGASGTSITPEMAESLGIGQNDYVDTIAMTTADGKTARVPRFRLNALSIGGLEVRNLNVAVAPIPLLGQDFLQNFEFTLTRNALVLSPHSEAD
ncbi:TIGR02281 family clan AA aspartic protease [Leptolyngbya sp. FACHB-261]|uniref:retropepsin-like aspartic protease family protein n=1 Tax=Leptolyngbya sp. FACHB-261 TaxID=2692806 RepID=UPI001687EE92|nr:retropepsin-like aspartic protease [Leptolyngbya sp. FACHB-261]MBD2102925.1 retroviral-like aspartic protease family protein [Leptolyngbya sp. FACHB-261]